jgi:hypothetical protein
MVIPGSPLVKKKVDIGVFLCVLLRSTRFCGQIFENLPLILKDRKGTKDAHNRRNYLTIRFQES